MPVDIEPPVATIVIGATTITNADWEANTPGAISTMGNALAAQQALLSTVGTLTKAITGNTTLTSGEGANFVFVFTGALSANANITFPAGFKGYAQIENQTTGGFALVCGLVAGATVTAPVGGAAAAVCDGTDFKLRSNVVRSATGANVVGALAVSGAAAVTGALTAATFNGNAFTAGTGTLAVAAGKTLTGSNTLNLTGVDGSAMNFGAGGPVAYTDAARSASSPVNPAATASTIGVMMGLAGTFTTTRSGNGLILVTGTIENSANGGESIVQIRTGTGTAPVNGAAITGNPQGSQQSFLTAVALQIVPFSLMAYVSGLGAPIWIDVSLTAADVAGNARIYNVYIVAIEV